MEIKVVGITENGDKMETTYLILGEAKDVFEAIQKAVGYAKDAYNSLYDENREPIPGTIYKEFETITSVEVIG